MNCEDILDQIDCLVIRLIDHKKFLERSISQADKEISSVYHSIELKNYDVVSGYKALVNLQSHLRIRRQLKNEFAKTQTATSHCICIQAKLKKARKKIDKIEATGYRKELEIVKSKQEKAVNIIKIS